MTIIIAYLCIWLICFFIALPIGISEREINKKDIYKKEIKSLYLLRKFVIVTIIAFPLTFLFQYLFTAYLLNNLY